ncbi:MAG: hypothetical protein KAI76_03225 [Alphaproteobacteria bacterium]|nr:hypothetical protein [Alphaproteobacteria bacterium]
MRIFKIASLLVFCVFVLLTVTQAFAQPAPDIGLLKPQGKWNVGIVKAQGESYCVMTNIFDGEVTLAFARNLDGYGSVAVGFRGSFFKQGSEYEVVLQADDAKARKFAGRVDGGHSVIVQIGMDDGFYLSLKGDGNLRVGLPEMDMAFDLREFSTSYISLLDCAGKLRHKGPRTAAMPIPPVEKSTLKSVKENVRPKKNTGKIAKLEQRQHVLMQQLIQQGKAAVLLAEQRRAIPPATKDGLRERELAARAARLWKEREDLQSQLAVVRKSIQENGFAVSENKSLKAELVAKRVQLVKLGKRQELKVTGGGLTVKEMEQKPDRKGIVSQVDIDDIIWNDVLRPQDAVAFSPREKELSRSIFALQKERDAVRAQLEMVRQFADESKFVARENNRLRTEIVNLQSEIAVLKSAQASVVDGLHGRLSQAQQHISSLANQLTFMSQQKEQLELKLDARDRQVITLRSAIGAKDRELLAAEIFSTDKDRQLSSLRSELVGLKSDRDEIIWKPQMQASSGRIGGYGVPQIQPMIHAVSLKEEPSLSFSVSSPVKEGSYKSLENMATVVVQ